MSDVRCPYCHVEFRSVEVVWTCPQCGTRQHRTCARDLGRCTVLGCDELVGAKDGPSFAFTPPPIPAEATAADRAFQGVIRGCLAAFLRVVEAFTRPRPRPRKRDS
jgi:hypothetical protein